MTPLAIAAIEEAERRIAAHILRTPLTRSEALSEAAGMEVWLKQENRQHTGSFKPRGALNKILQLTPGERASGIVAASAGNHALGVGHACRALGLASAHVYVQENAAPAKLAKLARYPVAVHLVGSTYEEAQAAALAHADRTGASYVSAYDDPAVVAGQGTCGLEIASALGRMGAVVVPVGGGALVAGIATAIKARRPGTRVVGVNPSASPSALLSLQSGAAIDPYDHQPTLAQGLAGGFGRVPFALAHHLIDEVVLVSEEEMKRAIAALIDAEQVIAEPSGCAAVAAILAGKVTAPGPLVAVISGGNIDSRTLAGLL